MSTYNPEREQIVQAIATLEAQCSALGAAVVEPALAGLRRLLSTNQLAQLVASPGERKLVTVMFADLAGFTALAERLDPEQVRGIINSCFDALVPCVTRYGGIIDKFIGDAVMALFGAPLAHENDAERALRAALEMMQALAAFNARQGLALGLHIGINTGLVVTGGLGATGYQQYSVLGDAVNLAARLEDRSGTGEILVGPQTYRLTAPLFSFEALEPHWLKGKADPVPVYRLTGVRASPSLTRGLAEVQAPLVGRAADLASLEAALAALRAGQGGIAVIIGESGMGKSRLVAELRAGAQGLRWAEGRAQSHTEGMSFAVVQRLLDALADVAPNLTPAEARAALATLATQCLGAAAAEILPYLARLHDLPLTFEEEERVRFLPPDGIQTQIRTAFTRLIRSACAEQPTVLVWEDLHWSDPSSLALLDALTPLTSEVPLLLLVALRPTEGRTTSWAGALAEREGLRLTTVRLEPLDAAASAMLLRAFTGPGGLPEEIHTLVLAKAEGNPFFLEELLRALIDAGAVLRERDDMGVTHTVATRPINTLAIPDTLQGVIAARIDQLPLVEKQVLQMAAVIGRVFQEPVLGAMPGVPQTDGPLAGLMSRGLVRRSEGAEYSFKQAVIHDVTYDSMLLEQRRSLHRAAAEAIMQLFPTQADELAATLALHYQRAGMAREALDQLERAARRAQSAGANDEAADLYRRALAQAEQLFPPGSDQSVAVRLYEALGDVLALVGHDEEARQTYAQACARLKPGAILDEARLRCKATAILNQRDVEAQFVALAQVEAILGLPPPDGPDATPWWRVWLEIQNLRLRAAYWQGDGAMMDAINARIEPVVQRYGSARQRLDHHEKLYMALNRRLRMVLGPTSIAMADELRAMAGALGDPVVLAAQECNGAFARLFAGDLSGGLALLDRAEARATRYGAVWIQVLSRAFRVFAHRLGGDQAAARADLPAALDLAEEQRQSTYIALCRANLAWLAWRDGDRSAARRQAEEAVRLWDHGMAAFAFRWTAHLVLLACADDPAEAAAQARAILAPSQQRLPDAGVALLEAVIAAEASQALSSAAVAAATAWAAQTGRI